MKQIKLFGVLAISLCLGLSACGKSSKSSSESSHTHTAAENAPWQSNDTQHWKDCKDNDGGKVDQKAHTFGDPYDIVAATCTQAGSQKVKCTVCQKEVTKPIPALGHDWVDDDTGGTPATCTEAGSKNQHCSRCDAVNLNVEVAALGHDYSEWAYEDDSKKPTCTAAGEQQRVCSRCNNVEKQTVAALGHDPQLVGDPTPAPDGEALVRLYECSRCHEQSLGFKADEPSADSLPHLMKGDHDGMRFFGRPIGNALALDATGKSVKEENNECVYCSTETGDFFEYIFTLTAEQAAILSTCRCYCDARPADHLNNNGGDFWAYGRSATDWTPGYYIDGSEAHVQHNEDGSVKMVKNHAQSVKQDDGSWAEGVELETEVAMGARIEDFRYALYVDDHIQQFDADTAVPVEGSSTNMVRKEYVLPFTFHLHEGQNKIRLCMAGGYRSEFYNFIFRPYVEPTPVTVNETTLEVREGKTAQITSSMTDLTYKSSSTSVCTVDDKGVVTGVKAGTATITVSKEGNYKDAKVAVTVLEKEGIITLNLRDGVKAPADATIDNYDSTSSGEWFRNPKKDGTLTYTFQSELAGRFDIQMGLRGSNIPVADNMSITVNATAVALTGTVNTSYSAVEYVVGQADLVKGENTMVITFLADSELYMKSIKLIPHVYVAFQTFGIEDLEGNRSDSGWAASKDFGGEKAFKFNKGNGYVEVKYTAEAAQKAMLQLKIAVKVSNKGLTGFWKQSGTAKTQITINGIELAAGAEPDFSKVTDSGVSDDGNISIPEWFNIAEVDLIAGENTIKVQFLTGGYSYYLGGIALAK